MSAEDDPLERAIEERRRAAAAAEEERLAGRRTAPVDGELDELFRSFVARMPVDDCIGFLHGQRTDDGIDFVEVDRGWIVLRVGMRNKLGMIKSGFFMTSLPPYCLALSMSGVPMLGVLKGDELIVEGSWNEHANDHAIWLGPVTGPDLRRSIIEKLSIDPSTLPGAPPNKFVQYGPNSAWTPVPGWDGRDGLPKYLAEKMADLVTTAEARPRTDAALAAADLESLVPVDIGKRFTLTGVSPLRRVERTGSEKNWLGRYKDTYKELRAAWEIGSLDWVEGFSSTWQHPTGITSAGTFVVMGRYHEKGLWVSGWGPEEDHPRSPADPAEALKAAVMALRQLESG